MRLPPPHPKRCGFTLAELLVVILIIGIMFALALPAFMNISGPSKLDAAANAVHAAAKFARQYAVANHQPTYLVFHTTDTTDDPNLQYRAYAVFSIDTHKQTVTQADGAFITDWATLPVGVVFNDQATSDLNNLFQAGNQNWTGGFNRNRQLKIVDAVYTAQAFSPKGKSQSIMDYKNDLYLADGFYENGSLVRTSSHGQRIRIEANGKSFISTITYNETGEPEEVEQ